MSHGRGFEIMGVPLGPEVVAATLVSLAMAATVGLMWWASRARWHPISSKLVDDGRLVVLLSDRAARGLTLNAARRVAGVVRVRVRLRRRRAAWSVEAWVVLDEPTSTSQTCDLLQSSIRHALDLHTGVHTNRVTVRVEGQRRRLGRRGSQSWKVR